MSVRNLSPYRVSPSGVQRARECFDVNGMNCSLLALRSKLLLSQPLFQQAVLRVTLSRAAHSTRAPQVKPSSYLHDRAVRHQRFVAAASMLHLAPSALLPAISCSVSPSRLASNAAGYSSSISGARRRPPVPENHRSKDLLQKMASDIKQHEPRLLPAAQGFVGGLVSGSTQVSQQKATPLP